MDCASCGAEIDSVDRYCPACRMPNMACERIPRFGPPERERPPAIAPRVTGPGQRSCPRCTSGVRSRDRYCRSCGLDVSLLPPPPLASDPRTGRPLRADGRPDRAYRPLAPSSAALRLIVGLIALTGVGLAAVSVVVWRQLGGEVTMLVLPDVDVRWALLESWVQGLAVVQVGLLVLGSVLMIRWTGQAARNLPALRVGGRTVAARWATWGWLIPGVNLVVPRQVVAELWRAADADNPVDGTAWRTQPSPTIVNLWWICTLVALPTVVLAGTQLASLGNLPPVALSDLHNARAAFVLLAVAEGLLLFAAALLARVIAEVTERQAARVAVLTQTAAPGTERRQRIRRVRARVRRPPPPAPEPTGPLLVHVGGESSPAGRY